MSTDDDDIMDAEIVDDERLPAVRASTRSRMDTAPPPRWSEEWWAGVSPETRSHRCVAHKANGDRCLKLAIKGATVCRAHGGATRHVKRAARVRLENAAELMAKQLLGIALTADSEGVKLAAIKDALDGAGLKARSEVVLSQGETKPYEQVFDVIGGTAPDESPDLSGGCGSAGLHGSPAPAYGEYDHGGKAEAGGGVAGISDSRAAISQLTRRQRCLRARLRPDRPTAVMTTATASLSPGKADPQVTGQHAEKSTSPAWRQSGWLMKPTGTLACGGSNEPSKAADTSGVENTGDEASFEVERSAISIG